MDSKRDQKKRQSAKIPTRKRGGENTRSEARASRTLEKPKDAKKSAPGRDIKETPQEVKKIFDPILEQLYLLIEYILISEMRTDLVVKNKISDIRDFMKIIQRNCEIYFNAQLLKNGN